MVKIILTEQADEAEMDKARSSANLHAYIPKPSARVWLGEI